MEKKENPLKSCTSCKSVKNEFKAPHHKTCWKCLERINRWERKNKRFTLHHTGY